MILRATGMLIILGVVTISLVSPELIGENGGVTSFLAAILCGIVCATAASILDRQEALMEQLQNTDARVARIEERIAPRRDPARQEEAPTTGAAD
jgi:cobalamin biosynthesis protein CobD/CbiB